MIASTPYSPWCEPAWLSVRCETDRCIEITPCGANTAYEADCLSEAEARAWSSPIYVNHAGS
jgi:hypothetical protein